MGCLAVVLWYEQVRQQPRRPGLLEVSARGSPLWLEEQVLSVARSERPDRILLGDDAGESGGDGYRAGAVELPP